jgi:DNA polymerase elongation subunit (family B)
LVMKLEDKMKLMELAISLAYAAKVNFNDVFGQVRVWDSIIYHYLNEHNIVIPPKKHSSKDEQYAGAYVKDPITGMHDWVVSFDLNSLYPHLIMQYNMTERKIIRLPRILFSEESELHTMHIQLRRMELHIEKTIKDSFLL